MQHRIGKILPIEGYYVLFDGEMPINYTQWLTHLYQPLIGIEAISLYQTLLSEYFLGSRDTPNTHHTLMTYISMPLDEIYHARLKLEGIGLLKTYKLELEQNAIYMYQLIIPFSPVEFFEDGMLSQLLFHQLGVNKFNKLKQTLIVNQPEITGDEITANFNEVFHTFKLNSSIHDEAPLPSQSIQDKGPKIDNPSVDFNWLEQMLIQRMLPVNKILTTSNKKLISQMMVLYDLTNQEIEKAVIWAVNEENRLDCNEFKTACLDFFQTKQNRSDIKLVEKRDKVVTQPTTPQKTIGKEDKFIQMLEQISPKQLLEDLSGGNQASAQDLKVIGDVMTKQGLNPGVMNVLVHYVMLKTDMKLTRSYMEKIASHWARKKVTTVRQAMALAKSEHKKYQQWGNTKKNYYQRPTKKEVIPDWFYEDDKSKQQNDNQVNNQEKLQQNDDEDDIAELLKDYIKDKKSNHL